MEASMRIRPSSPAFRLVVTTATLLAAAGPGTASARGDLCVGAEAGCFATVQPAVDAARDGDTIRLRPGTFAGGVIVDKSVTIDGSGARETVIAGGGPVVTIGEFGAAEEPTVSISGVTITGGRTTGGPIPDFERQIANGGGVFVPPGADNAPGATVTISDSLITDNRVSPGQSAPVGPPCPGDRACEFALAEGGGIDSFGALTLEDTTVSANSAGAATGLPDASSDGAGGGIASQGPLTLVDSAVVGNHASATAPNGRFGEGGGIWSAGPETTMRGGELSGNVAELHSALPREVEQLAIGAAMQVVNADATTTFDGVRIDGNQLFASNTVGDATAFAAGPHVFGTLVMRDSRVTNNRIAASIPAGSPGDAIATSGGIEIDDNGTVTGSRFEGNSVEVTSPNSVVSGGAGIDLAPLDGEAATIRDTVVRDNTLVAHAGGGSATVQGAGIQTIGILTLEHVTVERNAIFATGPDGVAQGGGIWNATAFFDGAPPAPELTLRDTSIRKNTIRAGDGIAVQGAGLFTDSPVTLDRVRIADNDPDQCFGC
jgi:hypothetical protein